MREIVGRGHAVDTIRFSIFLVKERLLQTQHRDEHRNRQTKHGLTPEQARGLINGFAHPQLNKARLVFYGLSTVSRSLQKLNESGVFKQFKPDV
jgi:hypothetical protein